MVLSHGAAGIISLTTYLIVFTAGLISDAADVKAILFSEDEVKTKLDPLKKVNIYNEKWSSTLVDYPGPPTEEELALKEGRKELHFPDGKAPPSFKELGDTPRPGFPNVSAKDMSRVIAFLRSKGWELRTTQDLGDCLYASVLRGIALKAEFVTAHLKRLLVVMITTFPEFFYHYLRYGIAATYGHTRPTPAEIDRQEREGEITADQAQILRLPGPFSLVSFCEYILKPGAWGDEHMLHLVSLLWQLRITILHATTLGEYRIRHNCRLQEVDLVVVFINGNHYMGTGEYRRVN